MTVQELIEKLKSFDENLKIVVSAAGVALYLDNAIIETEIFWQTKTGEEIEKLHINFD